MVGEYCSNLTTFATFATESLRSSKPKDTESIALGMYLMRVHKGHIWLAHGLAIQDLPLI